MTVKEEYCAALQKRVTDVKDMLNVIYTCLRSGQHSCRHHKSCISDARLAAEELSDIVRALKHVPG